MNSRYNLPISPMLWAEMGLGIYAFLAAIILGVHLGLQALPWLLIYSAGYFYIAVLNLEQSGLFTTF